MTSDYSHTNYLDSNHSNSDDNMDLCAQPTMSQERDRYSSEPLSQTMLDFANFMEEIEKLKAELRGAKLRENSFIQQIHKLFDCLQKKEEEIAHIQAQLATGRNSPSISTFSSIGSITSHAQTPEPRTQTPKPCSPPKKHLWSNLMLKFPMLDSAQLPKLSPVRQPCHQSEFSPPTQSTSRNGKNPMLLFTPLPSPSSSRGHYHNDIVQGQVHTLSLGSDIQQFLQEHGLQEQLGDVITVIYNTPVPGWLKLISSLELAEAQWVELFTALTNDCSAEGAY